MTCTGCGSKCEQIGKWARLLNGDEPCPHWLQDKPRIKPAAGARKVVFFSHALWRGGAERWLVDVATGLSREQCDVTIVLDAGKKDPALLSKASAVPVVSLADWNRDEPVDVIVCWCTIPPEIKARHTVFCLHGTGDWSANTAANASAVQGVHLTAVSDAAGELLAKYGEVQTIYNGCDTDRVVPRHGRDATRRRLGICPETLVVGFLGRMAALKQPHMIARAVARLRQRGVDARGLFVGDYQAQHKPRHEQVMAIDGRAIFTGPKEAIGDYLDAMDVLMLPSTSEGFSLAKIEAWLSGTPVVATPVGAIPELEKKHGALVVRVSIDADANALADAVLLASSPKNAAVVDYAKQLSHEHFTISAMVRRWEEYLLSL